MKKKFGFHIVGKNEDPIEENEEDIEEDIEEELPEYQDPMQEMKLKIKKHKHKFWRRVIIGAAVVSVLTVGSWLFFTYRTYGGVTTTASYESKEVDNSNYVEYAGGVLKYSRDGIGYLNQKSEEIWNQSYQMQNPAVEICKETAAVGDLGGSSILVLQKDGLKGEIKTTSPIQKFTVSEQGIVAAVLKKESTQQIICYDAKGNVLVEQSASLLNTGYPLDIAISNNGEVLLVSYVYTKGNAAVTKTTYYNFGEEGDQKVDHLVAEAEYENTVIPTVAFLNETDSVLIGDNTLVFNKGLDEIKNITQVKIEKEIKSVAYDENGVALVLKNSGKKGYELRIYNEAGKQTVSKEFEGEYGNITLTGNQIILFDGKKCSIFSRSGICKFAGKMDVSIMEIFPVFGLNKYMVINADGFYEIRLVK